MSKRTVQATPALSKLKSLKAHLQREHAPFADAVAVEAAAERLCQALRRGLVNARIEAGLDQGEFARRVDYSQSTISRLESGKGDLSLKVAFRLAYALGLRLDFTFAPIGDAAPSEEAEIQWQVIDAFEEKLSRIQEAVEETLQDVHELRSQREPAE